MFSTSGMKKRLIDFPKEFFKFPLAERLLARLTQQKPLGHFWSRLPPLNTAYSVPTLRTVRRNGICYELDLSDYMEWLVFWGIQVEPRQALYKLAAPGLIVVDVGANIGETTMRLAQLVGPLGFVHSFEPNSITFSKLARNIALNTFTNIRINSVGLGDKNEERLLGVQVLSNRGGARVFRNLSGGHAIQVIMLDEYLAHQQVTPVNLLKIDVEGFELHVLRGAEKTLQKFRPLLFIELDDNNLRDQGDSAQRLVKYLEDLGYSIADAVTGSPVRSDQSFANCHTDIIAR